MAGKRVSNALESSGYRLTDSSVTYHLPVSSNMGKTDRNISEAEPEDFDRLKSIAYNAFSDRTQNINRFNSDPRPGLSQSWKFVRTFCSRRLCQKNTDLTLVYKENGAAVGFMTFVVMRSLLIGATAPPMLMSASSSRTSLIISSNDGVP